MNRKLRSGAEVVADQPERLAGALAEHGVPGALDDLQACVPEESLMLALHVRSNDLVARTGDEQHFTREGSGTGGEVQDDAILLVGCSFEQRRHCARADSPRFRPSAAQLAVAK